MMRGLDMAQEDKNVTIPPEMMQEIVRVASETAIEKFHHEAERNRKAVKDKRLHNTKLLLQNYHCFVEHSKSAVYEASQLSEDDDFEELMEELMSQSDGRVRVPVVRSIQESAAHTRIIVQHIDRMLEYYKFRCDIPSVRRKCVGIGRFTTSTLLLSPRLSSRSPMKNTSICQPCSATRRRAFPS